MLWQRGWGYILPGWPCPGVSSDGAIVSPDPPLSQSLLSSLCVGGLGSEYFSCLVSCVNLSMLSLILSLSPSTPGGTEPWDHASGLPGVLLLQFQLFCLRLSNLDLCTGRATLSWTCCFRLSLSVSTSECSAMKSQLTFTPEVLTCCTLYNHCENYYLTLLVIYEHLNILAMFCLHPAQPEED